MPGGLARRAQATASCQQACAKRRAACTCGRVSSQRSMRRQRSSAMQGPGPPQSPWWLRAGKRRGACPMAAAVAAVPPRGHPPPPTGLPLRVPPAAVAVGKRCCAGGASARTTSGGRAAPNGRPQELSDTIPLAGAAGAAAARHPPGEEAREGSREGVVRKCATLWWCLACKSHTYGDRSA